VVSEKFHGAKLNGFDELTPGTIIFVEHQQSILLARADQKITYLDALLKQ
jgi:hypothetical protein